MRGDRPPLTCVTKGRKMFTPHARGSTLSRLLKPDHDGVYPACAGIDLDVDKPTGELVGLPRMRGDRPILLSRKIILPRFTPHARGSTAAGVVLEDLKGVYPACAGIDPSFFILAGL